MHHPPYDPNQTQRITRMPTAQPTGLRRAAQPDPLERLRKSRALAYTVVAWAAATASVGAAAAALLFILNLAR